MDGCESWTIKKAERWRIDALELWFWRRFLRVPWTARRSNQSILKDITQSWVLLGGTDVEAEIPILRPPDAKSWLIGHGFGWTPGVGDGQGSLACCGSWGRKESDTTERLNWTEMMIKSLSMLQDVSSPLEYQELHVRARAHTQPHPTVDLHTRVCVTHTPHC